MFRLLLALPFVAVAVVAPAADEKAPDLTDAKPLFNGTDFAGWQTADGKGVTKGWVVKDGALVRETAGGDIWTKARYGDFVLGLEFKTEGNSGVFIRTDKPTDNVQTGIEIQVDVPAKPGKHSVGALYDLVPPAKDNTKKGEWNALVVSAKGSLLTVYLNGEKVNEMDLDKWTEGGKNPDGTKNKFKTALKDFKREGHIGLQEHGAKVSYRNIKLSVIK
jgi:hypothetical protein